MKNRRFNEIIDQRQGRLFIGGVYCEEFLNECSSAYVYDLGIIEEKIECIKDLPRNVLPFYAVKANPSLAVVKHVSMQGLGLDVASSGELYCAKKAGQDMKKTLFTGPGKFIEEIKQAVGLGIRYFNCESENEAKKISEIARENGVVQKILLRVNTEFEVLGGTISTCGGSQKFGFDQEILLEEAKKISLLKNVEIAGIHCFSASNILDHKLLAENAEKIFQLARRLEKSLKAEFEVIDIGGGIGIPYSEKEAAFNINVFSQNLSETISKHAWNKDVIMELGRFIVGEAGYYLTKVNDVKKSRGTQIVLTAGGINHQLRPSLISPHPVILANREEKKTAKTMVGGPLCTPHDYFFKESEFPLTKEGDVVCVLNSGAYGYTEGMQFFLSNDMPPEYCVKKGKVKKVRKEIPMKEVVDLQECF